MTFRNAHLAASSLILIALAVCPSKVLTQSTGAFTATGSMTTARSWHTATLLGDGKVLITGGVGNGGGLASAELYDPATGTFVSTGNMAVQRFGHSATLLPDGRVLVVGGATVTLAEIYDPATGAFTATGNTNSVHSLHSATLLNTGKVLIGGGLPCYPELYDPSTGTFTATGADAGRYPYPALANLLADGRVLIVGYNPPEVYDPARGTFALTGAIPGFGYGIGGGIVRGLPFGEPTATLLANGKVLVAGGEDDSIAVSPDSAFLYDPGTGRFTATGRMASGRINQIATTLPDGMVLMAGGGFAQAFTYWEAATASAELFDPATERFAAAGSMTTPRLAATATVLNNGQVLIAGGEADFGHASLASAEVYRPAALIPPPALLSFSGDGKGQGAILHANTPRLASSSDPAVAGEYLEIYLRGLAGSSLIPPQVSIGGRLAEVVYFGNCTYPGVNQINVRVPTGVTAGPAVPVWISYIGRPSNQVTIGLR